MIRYALLCEREHAFEGWFRNSAAFESQSKAGAVVCPDCGSHEVRKAMMAPSLAKGSEGRKNDAAAADDPRAAARERFTMMMRSLRRHVEKNCDYVGDAFAEEARRIHYGEMPQRGIYGEATLDEARELVEEGVEVAPLPGLPRPAKRN